MALPNPFKLQKLLIEAFDNEERTKLAGQFEAMFNPESFSQNYKNINSHLQGLITSGRANKYILSSPTTLEFTLILDDTGITSYGVTKAAAAGAAALGVPLSSGVRPLDGAVADAGKDLNARLTELLNLIQKYKGDLHQSHYLKVTWGSRINGFECFLESVDITYTLFARNGDPLRAEVRLSLVEDKSAKKRKAEEGTSSPDLTRFLTVKSSDTLPQLAKNIYGDSTYYLHLAQVNGYDNFRKLREGSTIQIPRLEN